MILDRHIRPPARRLAWARENIQVVAAALLLLTVAGTALAAAEQRPATSAAIATSPAVPDSQPATVEEEMPGQTTPGESTGATNDAQVALDAAQARFRRLRDESRNAEAMSAAVQVAQLANTAYGPSALENARPLIDLANLQVENNELLAAEQNFLAAIQVIKLHKGRLSTLLIEPLTGLGNTYNRSGLNEQAAARFQQAMRINHVNLGFYNLEQLTIKDGLTESYVGLGDYEEANFHQESQLVVYQRKLGVDNPETVPAMYKLAEWYSRVGDLEASAQMYRGADRLLRESGGDTNARRSDALLGLARLYERQGNPPAAIGTLEKALKLVDEEEGSNPLQRSKLRVALGDIYARQGMSKSAEAEYMAAWETLSENNAYIDQRDEYFASPVRVAGGPLNSYAQGAQSRSANELQNGYVLISYTVNPDGRATDVRVVESEPTDVMDKSITTTFRRSYFRPRMEDGIPVVSEGLLARHEFKYVPQRDKNRESPDISGKQSRSNGKRIELPNETPSD